MPTKRTLTRQLADARKRVQQLVNERDEAVGNAGTGQANVARLAKQLSETRDQLDALQRKHDGDRPAPGEELRDARRALMLSERARASLDAQLVTVPAANDSLWREAVTRAGNLTTSAVTG